MASGHLGSADLPATTDKDIYTVPGGMESAVNCAFCNRTASTVTIRLAVRRGSGLTAADYLEYDSPIPPFGTLERTGIILSPGETVVMRASATGVSAQVRGYEEAI